MFFYADHMTAQIRFFITVLLAGFAFTANGLAAPPTEIGKFKSWRVYELGSGAGKICYILSQPVKKYPRNVRRGEIFMSVTHRPAQKVRHEVSIRIGYPFSGESNPYAQIGADNFAFFTGAKMGEASSAWAWLENPQQHDRMMGSMRRGNELVFKGTSSRGTLTTDHYSLLGFTAALNKINEACPETP